MGRLSDRKTVFSVDTLGHEVNVLKVQSPHNKPRKLTQNERTLEHRSTRPAWLLGSLPSSSLCLVNHQYRATKG